MLASILYVWVCLHKSCNILSAVINWFIDKFSKLSFKESLFEKAFIEQEKIDSFQNPVVYKNILEICNYISYIKIECGYKIPTYLKKIHTITMISILMITIIAHQTITWNIIRSSTVSLYNKLLCWLHNMQLFQCWFQFLPMFVVENRFSKFISLKLYL